MKLQIRSHPSLHDPVEHGWTDSDIISAFEAAMWEQVEGIKLKMRPDQIKAAALAHLDRVKEMKAAQKKGK